MTNNAANTTSHTSISSIIFRILRPSLRGLSERLRTVRPVSIQSGMALCLHTQQRSEPSGFAVPQRPHFHVLQ